MKTRSTLIGFLLLFFSIVGSAQDAPVTVLPHVYNPAVGAAFTVPVTVSNFEDIGGISLIFDYDPAVLTFQNAIPNAAFPGFVVNGTTVPGRIIISWFAMYGVTLADDTHLLDITFINNGGTTALSWSTADEVFCEYAKYDGGAYTVLNDSPFTSFYINGLVTSPAAPLTWAPVITNATPGNLAIPVKVNGFRDIGAISLTLEYDPAVIQYLGTFTPHPDLVTNGAWQVGTQDAPGGKKYLVISWTKNAEIPPLPPANLPDFSTLINLDFSYLAPGGTTELTWVDDGTSCEYADGNYQPLDDSPTSEYYQDGLVTGQQYAPMTVAPCITGIIGQPVVFPVRVYGFSNIGAISLTLDYDPAVLTYQSTDPVNIPGTWSTNAGATAGRFILGSFGSGFSLPDGSVLFNITFIYHGGSCLLTWYDDDAISCEYADAPTLTPLYDIPREDFYINGCVGPAPVINGKTFLEGPYNLSSSEMDTDLKVLNLLPSNQPYGVAPWNYPGTETVGTFTPQTTDWVLVQLRTSPLASSAIATRAALLTKNGAITDVDGISPVYFPGIIPGYYYLVIYHRNHMAVMSANPFAVNPYSGLYDFSAGPSMIYGNPIGIKLIDPSVNRWGMLAADASNDQNIFVNDYTDYWVPDFGLTNYYSSGDFNLDGKVFIDDFSDFWVPNFGISNSLP